MSWFAVGALVVTAIGAGVTAYSQHEAGKAQEDAAKFNAKIAENNAAGEAEAATENAARQRKQNRRQLANIRARQAGSGVNIGMGSSLDVIGTAASELELQALDLFREGEIRARTYQNEAQSGLWAGAQAKKAGNLQAAGSLISGAGSVAGGYTQYKNSGVIATGKT